MPLTNLFPVGSDTFHTLLNLNHVSFYNQENSLNLY